MLEARHAARRTPALTATQPIARPEPGVGIAVRPLPADARFSLRLDPAEARAVRTAAGFELDIPLNRRSALGGRSSARLGPNEWLLIAPDSEAELIAGEIEAALGGRFHALVDIGNRNVAIEVAGRHAAAVLNSGCPLDLSEAAFPSGAATRTLLGKAEVVLMRLDDAPTYRVECWRSYARYVHDFLLEAAREFQPSAP